METKELDDCQKALPSDGSKSTPIESVSKKKYMIDGNMISFGKYPQTRVEPTVENGLSSISFDESTWTNYGYFDVDDEEDCMYYIDVDTDGDGMFDYRGVYIASYRNSTFFLEDDEEYYAQQYNGYSTDTIYWFKYEPIRWTILKEKDGKALIMTDLILDSQDYNHTDESRTVGGRTIYANDYAESCIRKWLNDTFYETAFSGLEKSIILTTEVDNSATTTASDSNPYVCANTNDKGFLLSYKEAVEYFSDDETRMAKITDYARCQGADVSDDGIGCWWLRSPCEDYGGDTCVVEFDGCLLYYLVDCDGILVCIYVSNAYVGVRPAYWIKL